MEKINLHGQEVPVAKSPEEAILKLADLHARVRNTEQLLRDMSKRQKSTHELLLQLLEMYKGVAKSLRKINSYQAWLTLAAALLALAVAFNMLWKLKY